MKSYFGIDTAETESATGRADEEVGILRPRRLAGPPADPVRDQRLHAPLPVVAVQHAGRELRKVVDLVSLLLSRDVFQGIN